MVINSQAFHKEGLAALRKVLLFLWMKDSEPDQPNRPSELLILPLSDSWMLLSRGTDLQDHIKIIEDPLKNFIAHDMLSEYAPPAVLDRLVATFRAPSEKGTPHILKLIFWFLTALLVQPAFAPHFASSRVFEELFTAVNDWTKDESLGPVLVLRSRLNAIAIAEYDLHY